MPQAWSARASPPKAAWLIVYAGPRVASGRTRELPAGSSLSFAAIVVIWPLLVPWSALFGVG